MFSPLTWMRYIHQKFNYALCRGIQKHYASGSHMTKLELCDFICKNMLTGKIAYLHWYKGGEQMAPTIAGKGETLLVRRIPFVHPTFVSVGDVVLLKDPEEADNYMVRRLTAVEGYEMVSTDEKDEPFVLEMGHCWVVADNEKLKAEEAKDSRSFGPVRMGDIAGRVIYYM